MTNKEEKLKGYEDFTVGLALLDSVPVIFFILSLIFIATALLGTGVTFYIVLIGSILIAISGLCKVFWKLFLGLRVGNFLFLNKMFVPFMAGGFFTVVIGLIVGTILKAIKWGAVFTAIIGLPQLIFFIIGFIGLFLMGYVKSQNKREEFNKDAKKNWIAQCINAVSQGMMFLGIFFAIK